MYLELFQPLIADSDAYEAGKTIGKLFWSVLMLAGVLKCLNLAQRPTTNAKCCYGLAVVLGSFAGFNLVNWISSWLPPDLVLAGYSSLLLAVGFGVVLSAAGIYEYVNAPLFKYKQGMVQGIVALVLSLLPIGGFVWGVKTRLEQRGLGKSDGTVAEKRSGSAHTFPEYNFKLSALPDQWVKVDAKKINPLACIAFVRASPQIYMMVIAERTEGGVHIDTELLADVVKANMKSAATTSTVTEEAPHSAAGIAGKRLHFDAKIGNLRCHYINWVGSYEGYCYQVLLWKDHRVRTDLRAEADKVLAGFSLLDPAKAAAPTANSSRSDTYGYAIQAAGTPWTPIVLGENFPNAAQSFSAHGGAAIVTGYAVPLGELNPHFEAVLQGMLESMNIDYPNETLETRRDLRTTDVGLLPDAIGFEGCEIDYERKLDNKTWVYRIRVMRHGNTALLWAAWHAKIASTRARDTQALEQAMAMFKLKQPHAEPVLNERMKENERNAARDALNNMGHYYFTAKSYSDAAKFYQASFERVPTDEVILENWLTALSRDERHDEALALLEKHFAAFQKDQKIRSRRAYLLDMNGRSDEALKLYSELFAEGYENANDFSHYLRLLQDNNQGARAAEEIEKRRQKRDTNALAIQHAQILAGNKGPRERGDGFVRLPHFRQGAT